MTLLDTTSGNVITRERVQLSIISTLLAGTPHSGGWFFTISLAVGEFEGGAARNLEKGGNQATWYRSFKDRIRPEVPCL